MTSRDLSENFTDFEPLIVIFDPVDVAVVSEIRSLMIMSVCIPISKERARSASPSRNTLSTAKRSKYFRQVKRPKPLPPCPAFRPL
jgi:hypothetical protein